MSKVTLLLVEDDPDLQELISTFLETHFSVIVLATDSANAAIQLLKEQKAIACVISDYNLTRSTGGEIFLYLKEQASSVPFVLCSTVDPKDHAEFAGSGFKGSIRKPFRTGDLISFMTPILNGISPDTILQPGDSQYHPFRLKTLLKMSTLPADLYIKLSNSKYVKVAHQGTMFGKTDYDHYVAKKVESLYARADTVAPFLNNLSQDLLSLSQAKSLPENAAYEGAILGHTTIHQTVAAFGFTGEAQELAKTCAKLALRTLVNEPAVAPLMGKLNRTRTLYFSEHSVSLAETSCMLASLLGWTSESTQYKLSLAALLHDLTVENNEIAMGEIDHILKGTEKEKLERHPLETVNLIKQMKDTPADVDSIVLTHHERPGGIGFPNHVKAVNISPLGSLFIVAHDFVNYTWMMDKEVTIPGFLALYEHEYKSGVFKQLFHLLAKQSGYTPSSPLSGEPDPDAPEGEGTP